MKTKNIGDKCITCFSDTSFGKAVSVYLELRVGIKE